MTGADVITEAVQKSLVLIRVGLQLPRQSDYWYTFALTKRLNPTVGIEKIVGAHALQEISMHIRIRIDLNTIAQRHHYKLRAIPQNLNAHLFDQSFGNVPCFLPNRIVGLAIDQIVDAQLFRS